VSCDSGSVGVPARSRTTKTPRGDKEGVPRRLTTHAVNYATGTLLGAALLGMMPHALRSRSGGRVFSAVLAGIVLFFLLEKLMIWRHYHKGECEIHSSSGALILLGGSIHNFVDGVAIAAVFCSSLSAASFLYIALADLIPNRRGEASFRGFVYQTGCLFLGIGTIAALHMERQW
jgi:zinc transporter ZupT